jgi:hypothetical protein
VTIQEINDATLQMTLNCPNEPIQYLEKGNDRRIYLEYENEGQTTEEGKASLPLVTRFIAIPPGAVLQANVIHRQTRTIENVRIVPVVPDGDDPQTRDWVDDETWLQSDEAFPRESVVVGDGVRCRNLWLVPVTISPTRYYPQDGRLEIDDNLEIQLTLQGSSFRDPSIIQGPLVESFHQMYKSVVANYDLLEIDQEPIRGTYLIICPNNQTVIDELHDLIQWKHRKGYPVVLATTAVTGGDMTSIIFETHMKRGIARLNSSV